MHIKWIRDGLTRSGKTQRGLAKAMGIDPSNVSRLLSGQRKLKLEEIDAVAAYFGTGPGAIAPRPPGMAEERLFGWPDIGVRERDVEVRGVALGGSEGTFLFNGEVVDYMPRAPGLIGAPNAFALYVIGDSMAPRYEPGDMIFLDPGRPVRAGDDVVVELAGEHGEPGRCYIKRLIRRTPTRLVLKQFNPGQELLFATKDVRAIHRILSVGELIGA
jgi:phage repressor protein C with HTH and peptisase S24 domain